jgi:CheY-like chemotaxis protein
MARILIVDDDRLLRELIRLQLVRGGHAPVVTGTAAEALRAACESAFDLVITDLDMPHMDGLELVQALGGDEQTRNVPVMMITASRDEAARRQAMRLGVKRYMRKPVRGEELLREIEWALGAKTTQPMRPAA